jgi:hypothetical protein
MSLGFYIDAFRTLNVNRTRGHPSPHKVCMLLAVMPEFDSSTYRFLELSVWIVGETRA